MKKLEIFDIAGKTSLALSSLSFKIKQMFFCKDDTLYILCKNGVYYTNQKQKWHPKAIQFFSGRGTSAMDMLEYNEQILVLQDNSDLLVFEKSATTSTTIKLKIDEAVPYAMALVKDILIIGCDNGNVFQCNLLDPEEIIQLPKPPHLGENSGDSIEFYEYPDTRVVKAYGDTVAVLFSDKTMLFYGIGKAAGTAASQIIKSHFGGIYDIDCYPSTGNSFQFCFVTGSTDKTLRRWVANVEPKDNSCQLNQDKLGLLCDNFDHLKKKVAKEDSNDIGNIRCIKLSRDKDISHIA